MDLKIRTTSRSRAIGLGCVALSLFAPSVLVVLSCRWFDPDSFRDAQFILAFIVSAPTGLILAYGMEKAWRRFDTDPARAGRSLRNAGLLALLVYLGLVKFSNDSRAGGLWGFLQTAASDWSIAVVTVFAALFGALLSWLQRLDYETTAVSPDGAYRVRAGFNPGLFATSDYIATVEIEKRRPLIGFHFNDWPFHDSTVFDCVETRNISAFWQDSKTVVIQHGCAPSANGIQSILRQESRFRDLTVKYDFKLDWILVRPP